MMASSTHHRIDPFDPKKIKLEVWLSMLQAHFAYVNVTDDIKKKNILLISLGSETYSVLASLCAPSLPDNALLSYNDIVTALKSHYIVKPSYHRSLIKFQQRKKMKPESLRELYADLKNLAADCNFGDQFDNRVRDQLFMAIDSEIYFPNLAAEKLDLQQMTSANTLERILTFEKAFCSEKSLSSSVNALKITQKGKPTSRKYNYSCFHCGFPHRPENCQFSHLVCAFCKTEGHLQRMCPKFLETNQKSHSSHSHSKHPHKSSKEKPFMRKGRGKGSMKKRVHALEEEEFESEWSDSEENEADQLFKLDLDAEDSDNSEPLLKLDLEEVNTKINDDSKVFKVNSEDKSSEEIRTEISLKINNNDIKYEVDCGAKASTINSSSVEKLNLPIQASKKGLRAYGDHAIPVIGKVLAKVQYGKHKVDHSLMVVEDPNVNLCGKDLMPKIGIKLTGIQENLVSELNVLNAESQLEHFNTDPKLPVPEVCAKIHLKSDALPKFHRARPVPNKYTKMVEDALDKLVEEDIIESVKFSDWASPIVPVLKDDKSMRICGDFKYVNTCIACEKYPLPRLEEIFAVVGKSKIFSKIDLKDAYLQLPIDEESQKLLVINTSKGLFKYKRLPFGVSSAPAIFQRFMSQLLMNVEGVIAFLDDIFIGGETQEEHDERLNRVLRELQKNNVSINKKKSVINTDKLEYLGYVISGDGIRPSPQKLTAILEAPSPKSVSEVKSFLGMVTYYSRFIPRFSTILAPLYDLLKKDRTFKWSNVEDNAFKTVKAKLSESNFLANFDGDSSVIIEVDASPVGVGCVLMQKIKGIEQPIYFASKKLSPAELKYSQLDKEALALVFAVSKFKYFLLGRKFVIRTDHKPLLGLFGRDKQIPVNANARVQRWALLLSQYDYDLCFKAGKDNVVADALSRLPVSDSDLDSTVPAEYVHMVQTINMNEEINFEKIKSLTKRDPILKKVLNNLKLGWTNDPLISEYARVKEQLSIHDNVILYGNRIVIPSELQCDILKQLHVGHNGITAMKAEARKWVWWPKIDQDLSEVTKACEICFTNFKPVKAPVLSWPISTEPWDRIHVDYAGPIDNKYFLIIVDAYTKFLDVHITQSTTSAATIEKFRETFCNFGLPNVLVSDNAPYFVSEEMESFLRKNDIKHATPAPYNPSSNGLAERAVKTFKEGLVKFKEGSLKQRVCRFLYNYRRAVHSSTGKSPSELMFNRTFKGQMERIRPKKGGKDKDTLCESYPKYDVDDAVFARNYGAGNTWLEGKIVEVLGLRNFKVQLKNFGNVTWKRHADQLMPRFNSNPNDGILSRPSLITKPSVLPSIPSDIPCEGDVTGLPNDVSTDDTNLKNPVESNVDNKSQSNEEPLPEPAPSLPEPVTLRRSGRIVKPPDRLNL